jgi:hypothetical protein
MITIGATQNGYVVGQDATALSRMNNGLLDTFKPKISSPNTNDASYSTGSLNEDYQNTIIAYNTFIKELGSKNTVTQPNYNIEAITNFQQTAVSLTEYDQAAQTIADNLGISKDKAATTTKDEIVIVNNDNLSSSPNSGFLPFNLSLTMDGLSGMKIFQKYTADVDFLPSNYPTSLEFIINGISNTIQNNEWTTTLDSFAIPKNPFGSSVSKSPTSAASNLSNRSGGTSRTIEGVKYKNGEIPENKLRVINNASKYKGAITSDGGRIRLYEKASLALDRLIIAAEQAKIPNLQTELSQLVDNFEQNKKDAAEVKRQNKLIAKKYEEAFNLANLNRVNIKQEPNETEEDFINRLHD